MRLANPTSKQPHTVPRPTHADLTRAAPVTLAGALAVVDLVARTEGDTELVEHLLTALRSFLLE